MSGRRAAAASVVVVLLAVAAVLLGIRQHDDAHQAVSTTPTEATELSALSAARGEAVALTTIGYKSAAADVNRVLAGATGQLKKKFEKEKGQLPATLQQNHSTSQGSVLSAGLTSLTTTSATAVVAVDATVTGTDVGGSGVLKHYRMVVSLRRLNGRWLASKIAFAGQPQ
jgi:Mce-associated membrane protein